VFAYLSYLLSFTLLIFFLIHFLTYLLPSRIVPLCFQAGVIGGDQIWF